jgi:hypothetical protein
MSNMPPSSTIHILAGTYQTHGGWVGTTRNGYMLKSGQKVIGSGIDVTILQLASDTIDGKYVIFGDTGTNMEVSDLTCDCNGSQSHFGVSLQVSQNAVRRVKVIRASNYTGKSSEAWGIVIGNYSAPDSVGNIVEECEISQYTPGSGGISAISFNGVMSGVIRNNRIFLSPAEGAAINGSYTHDVLIEGNYVDGADCGYYGDTGGTTNIIIAHNTFKNCADGIDLQNTTRQNMTFAFNNILLTTNSSFTAQIGFCFGGSPWCTNFSIIGNTVSWNGPTNTGLNGYFLDLANVQGLVVTDNRVDSSLQNYFFGSEITNNYVFYHNYDLSGTLLQSLNQINQPIFSILPPDAYITQYGGGTVSVGQFITGVDPSILGWICPSNANAGITKPLPSPYDFFGGKTVFVTSWDILTTNSGTYSFNIGNHVYTSLGGPGGTYQTTITFAAPTGTNITLISATNTIPAGDTNFFTGFIYLGNQIQPGNYVILKGNVKAQ